MQRAPCDIRRLIGGQINHCSGHILNDAKAAQRNLSNQRRALGFSQRARHVGVDETRRHTIDSDVPATDFPGQCLGKALCSGFGRSVIGLPGKPR